MDSRCLSNLGGSLLAVLVAAFVVYILKAVRVGFEKNLWKIPGPALSRFTNVPLKVKVLGGQRTHYIHALHEQYGPIVRIAPTDVAVADIKAYREIHKIGTQFTKAPWYQNQHPLQTTDGTCGVFGVRDLHKAAARRKLYQQAGTKSAVLEWEPVVVEIVKQTVKKIKQNISDGKTDVMKWWSLMTADVLGSLAFGEPFRLVEHGEKNQMSKDIETSMILIGVKTELPLLWTLIQNIPLPRLGKSMELFRRFSKYGEVAVQNTKAASKGSAKTLFSKMIPDEGEQHQAQRR